jgi:hypothetical protein
VVTLILSGIDIFSESFLLLVECDMRWTGRACLDGRDVLLEDFAGKERETYKAKTGMCRVWRLHRLLSRKVSALDSAEFEPPCSHRHIVV